MTKRELAKQIVTKFEQAACNLYNLCDSDESEGGRRILVLNPEDHNFSRDLFFEYQRGNWNVFSGVIRPADRSEDPAYTKMYDFGQELEDKLQLLLNDIVEGETRIYNESKKK